MAIQFHSILKFLMLRSIKGKLGLALCKGAFTDVVSGLYGVKVRMFQRLKT